jgi:outer membrane lipoprotein-sorting protein
VIFGSIPLLAALALAPADMPDTAAAALQRAKAHYSDGAGYQSTFVQTYTPSGFASTRRESGTVWIQARERLRFDYAAPENKVFTFDAGEGRFYSPQDKQLTVKKLTPEERVRLPLVFLSDPDELSAQYAIAIEPTAGDATRLLLSPRAKRPELSWLRLTIAPDGSVPELSYEDEGGNRTEFRFEAWRREKARPAEDFRVTGPKGTRTVEQ